MALGKCQTSYGFRCLVAYALIMDALIAAAGAMTASRLTAFRTTQA